MASRRVETVAADLRHLTSQVVAFRDARDWKQFHNPKDVALSLVLEATEVLELFQWKDAEAAQTTFQSAELADELADVLYWVLLIAHDANIDLSAALQEKLRKNADRYPVEKARGKNSKYTEL